MIIGFGGCMHGGTAQSAQEDQSSGSDVGGQATMHAGRQER